MIKGSFVLGYSNISEEELDLLLFKINGLYTFKEIEMKNLISSFIYVDVFISGKKLTSKVKEFLKNIEVKVYYIDDYKDHMDDLIHEMNKYLLGKKKQSEYIKNALLLLDETFKKGNLNHHELNHSIRVGNETKKFGEYLKFPKNYVNNLFIYGLLHDIGKAGIPNKILNKKGRLNTFEFQTIKAHPVIGSYLVPKNMALIIKEHHERYDGSGYPKGLKKTKINYEARIIAIIDSYDAMVTRRSYKTKVNKDKALRELLLCITPVEEGGKGIKYDPELTTEFIKSKLQK
ncbi:MAG TPA: HD domain-containing protein [Bacilli bacterium]|nr:HD domain-containing protein [Bacilli bacterium]